MDTSVAAAFDLSYQDLSPDQQRLFQRIGLHPGTDVDARAAAALDGTDAALARRNIAALYDHYLLAEPARGRYRMHDLIRALEGIGRTHLHDGQPGRAAPPLRQALAIYQKFGSLHTSRVEALLRDHDL